MSDKKTTNRNKNATLPDIPRVPLAVDNPLGGDRIQVNFCKNPTCANFGAPAVTSPVKPGPSENRDDRYAVESASDGFSPALRCKSCREKPIIKSNAGIAEEIWRLSRNIKNGCGCRNSSCSAHGLDVAEYPHLYHRFGKTTAGTSRFICKSCKNVFSYGRRRKFKDSQKTEDLFRVIMNKVAIRRSLEVIGWKPTQTDTFYRRLDVLVDKCKVFSGIFDRQLAQGNVDLGALFISTDMQQYTINWDDAAERKNTVVNAVFSVDNKSGFIFCAHPAFDSVIDVEEVDRDYFAIGDHKLPEAFRKYSRLWMPGDELRPHRKGDGMPPATRGNLAKMIEAKYAHILGVPDTEDTQVSSKPAQQGKMIHYPYTAYASMFILEQLTKGAAKVVHCLDQDSASRAACLVAFENRIRKGGAHAFYVKINKNFTVPERRTIRKTAVAQFRAINEKLFSGGAAMEEVIAVCMKQNIIEARKLGPWQDEWVKHPLPRMDEPEKALCWLTGIGPSVSDETLRMFMGVSMHGVDNTLQLVRRRISMLERPIKTASAKHANWSGYSFYKPKNIDKVLSLFRCYLNFCVTRQEDNTTAAMRLGIADKPYTISDIVNLDAERYPAIAEQERLKILPAA